MTIGFPVRLNHFFVSTEDNSILPLLRDLSSSAATKRFTALQRSLSIEIGPPRPSYGYDVAKAQAGHRHMVFAHTEDTDELVGYAVCLTVDYLGREQQALITEIIVQEEYQHRGIGLRLLEAVEITLRQAVSPIRTLRTMVAAQNWRAISFFEQAGYGVICKGDAYLLHRSIPSH